jgi:hypothetical protein
MTLIKQKQITVSKSQHISLYPGKHDFWWGGGGGGGGGGKKLSASIAKTRLYSQDDVKKCILVDLIVYLAYFTRKQSI